MKKVLMIVLTIVAVIALGNVVLASAQGGTRPNQPNAACPVSGYTCPFSGTMPNGMMGRGGMMGGRGMHGMMGAGTYTGTMPMHGAMMAAGGMHEQVWTAIAQELDLTYEQLTQAVQNGQTIAQLAEAQGVELEDLQQAARDAHQAALTDLVEQGVLTQDQANWMLDHLEDMPMFNFEQGFGPGMLHGRGMMGGHGMMQNWQQPTGPQG
ncbi:hypothetical protein TFLX_02097 [Thermoflexales bacterium]|nr:hypothetical protein TFLX_02097 [Thermoflexales bacterium]